MLLNRHFNESVKIEDGDIQISNTKYSFVPTFYSNLIFAAFIKTGEKIIRDANKRTMVFRLPSSIKVLQNHVEAASTLIGKIESYYGYMFAEDVVTPYRKNIVKIINKYFTEKEKEYIKNNVIIITNKCDKYPCYNFDGMAISYNSSPSFVFIDIIQGYLSDYIDELVIHEMAHVLIDHDIIREEPYKAMYRFLKYFRKHWVDDVYKREGLFNKYIGRYKTITPNSYEYSKLKASVLLFETKDELFPGGFTSNFDEFAARYEEYSRTNRYPKLCDVFRFEDLDK